MKIIALIACLASLASASFGYDERVERVGGEVRASFVAPSASIAGGPSAQAPIPGNFYAYRGVFQSQLSCDDFLAKVHGLISDWGRYPHPNFYALSRCVNGADPKSTTELIYGLDAWRPDAVSEVQAFLRDHQGRRFEGKRLKFSAVKLLDVKTVLTLGHVAPNGNVSPVHSQQAWSTVPGTAQWFPQNYERARIVAQSDLDVFLAWVGKTFGAAEEAAFAQALAKSDFVQFSDFFRLHLANGDQADFWLAFGGARRCGDKPCFIKGGLPQGPGASDKPAFGQLARQARAGGLSLFAR